MVKPVLTREQAIAIRERYQNFRPNIASLAAQYGVSGATISMVIQGRHATVRDLPNIARARLATIPGKYDLRTPGHRGSS